MMFYNLLHFKKKEKPMEYLSVQLNCIVYDLTDSNEPTIKEIRDYCQKEKIIYSTRRFNSNKYSNDRNFIRELPAFHIYINDIYKRTFYPNTRPYQHIQEVVKEYKDRIERKRKRREERKEFYNNIYNGISKSINILWYGESLIDRVKREKKKAEEKDERERIKKDNEQSIIFQLFNRSN